MRRDEKARSKTLKEGIRQVLFYQEKHSWLWSFSINLLQTSLPDEVLQIKENNHCC